MILNKWNYKKHTYEPFEVPDNRKIRVNGFNLKEVINCANCGKEVVTGNTYSSLTIHNRIGLGYCVCEECYEKEWKERLKYRRK